MLIVVCESCESCRLTVICTRGRHGYARGSVDIMTQSAVFKKYQDMNHWDHNWEKSRALEDVLACLTSIIEQREGNTPRQSPLVARADYRRRMHCKAE